MQQYVWVDGKRVPFKARVVKPKDPKDYDPPQAEQELPESAAKGKQEPPKATESK
ncbi:hypothetical protein [Gimesia algae]|nr:hypothetical protein [Gimesia algae]